MMDRLLEGLGEFAGAYLNDLVVLSQSWEEHIKHLQAVFAGLKKSGLTAKPKKCQFGMAQYVYLGHIVGRGKVRVETSKVKVVMGIPAPRTKKDVRAFLGLTGNYWKFIANYASIATPLTDLTWKSEPNCRMDRQLRVFLPEVEGLVELNPSAKGPKLHQDLYPSDGCIRSRGWCGA